MKANIDTYEMLRKKLDALKPLPPAEFNKLIPFLEFISIKKGAYINCIDQPLEYVYFILKGVIAEFTEVSNKSKERILQFYHEKKFAILDTQMFQSKKSISNLICIRSVTAFRIKNTYLSEIMFQSLDMLQLYRSVLYNHLILNGQRIRLITDNNIERQYYNLLDNLGELENEIPQKYLAAYLGITRQSLSRLRALRQLNSKK